MQHLFVATCPWYFALGASQKSSLCADFCRQHNYSHYVKPSFQSLNPQSSNPCIIEGPIELFYQVQQIQPDLSIIQIGKDCLSQEQAKIVCQYKKIGRHFKVQQLKYEDLRKQLYPNLIFFYGPVGHQNQAAAITLAGLIDYKYITVQKNINQLILELKKSQNYIVNGFFTNPQDLKILQKYFNFKVIHFKYARIQLPDESQFFNQEYILIPYLHDKPYYVPVKGSCSPVKIMDDVGISLCPRLLYADIVTQKDREYVDQYSQQTDGLVLIIEEIQEINQRKKIPVAQSFDAQLKSLTTLFYKDLKRKQIIISSFPNTLNELIVLENINRKIDRFIDLRITSDYEPSMQYTIPIYFLETQKIVIPNKDLPLKSQLQKKTEYWIVHGAVGSGKTTVAKHMAHQFDLKLIQFESYIAGVKEKLANPDEGEEVPLKKILAYFSNLINQDRDSVYIFDGLTYEQKDFQEWMKVVGEPSVICLCVQQNQQIKRTRKKAQSDVNAEIGEQQSTKAKQSWQKCKKWLQKVESICPEAKIFNVDYNMAKILAENSLNSIMKPRIFLVQMNNNLVYQNIALKHDMGFINLRINRLRECKTIVKNSNRRDIILSSYEKTDERLLSEDLYWIENNLGEIRYLGIWSPEPKEAEEQQLVIQKEIPVEKPKPAQGEAPEGQQKPVDPPAEQGENQNKKKFDILDYKWTKPKNHKNLSQWFFKLKKHIKQDKHSPIDCLNGFGKVLEQLNSSPDINFYQIITR